VAHTSFGSIGIELLSQRDQIVKRLDAELRSILLSHLWLGCRDRDQKARAITMLDLVADGMVAAAVHRPNDPERPTVERMRRIEHRHFNNG
jgi:hypothetical protein